MSAQTDLRKSLVDSLNHVDGAFGRLQKGLGKGGLLTFPDVHKTSEGLFLSAWASWEWFVRELMITDLASDKRGFLLLRATQLRSEIAARELALRILGHPDEDAWVEWASVERLVERADAFLDNKHRFTALTPMKPEINQLRKIRNAVAHKSDRAWSDFRKVVQAAPFNLPTTSLRWLTVGRFLSSNDVNGQRVLRHCTGVLKNAAFTLVP